MRPRDSGRRRGQASEGHGGPHSWGLAVPPPRWEGAGRRGSCRVACEAQTREDRGRSGCPGRDAGKGGTLPSGSVDVTAEEGDTAPRERWRPSSIHAAATRTEAERMGSARGPGARARPPPGAPHPPLAPCPVLPASPGSRVRGWGRLLPAAPAPRLPGTPRGLLNRIFYKYTTYKNC